MSQVSPYAGINKRRFEHALLELLLREYGLLQGGRRILGLLVEDVLRLLEEYYPEASAAGSGTLVWTCTADEGRKAQPGKRTEEYRTATVLLPLVTAEEAQARTQRRVGQARGPAVRQARDRERAVRLVKAAAEQGGLLTLAELSVILNCGYEGVRQMVRSWEEETGELLPLKGYRMDQGSRPTHKKEIVRLYEEGLAPPDVARASAHSLRSVERYLQDYERVKLLLKRRLGEAEISAMIGRGPRLVREYVEIARQYHPELFGKTGKGK
jgi:hypothetical protein